MPVRSSCFFITPGPVWLATAARALAHGWRAAIPLVMGVALGDAVWSVAAVLGLAWIVGTYGWVMDAFALGGGGGLRPDGLAL